MAECSFTKLLSGGGGGGGAICPYMSSINDTPCSKNSCDVWDNINEKCGTFGHLILTHLHESHLHPKRHECPNLQAGCGGSQGGGDIPDIPPPTVF